MKKDQSGAEITLGCLAMTIIAIVSLPVEGWAVSTLWRWFVVPQFGLAPLSIWTATGIATLIQLIVSPYSELKDDDTMLGVAGRAFSRAFFRPALLVGMGWLILWMGRTF